MSYSLKSLVRGATVYTLCQVTVKSAAFLLIPVYTRFLSTRDYGILGLLEVGVATLTTILLLGTPSAQTLYIFELEKDETSRGRYLFSVNLVILLLSAAVAAGLSVFRAPLAEGLLGSRDPEMNRVILAGIWLAFFSVPGQLLTRFYMARRKYTFTAFLEGAPFLVGLAAILGFIVIFREGALGKVKGLLAGQVFLVLFFYGRYARNFKLPFQAEHVYRAVAYGAPVALHLLAGTLLTLIDRVILKQYVDLPEIGRYTLGYQVGMVMSVLTLAFNKSWAPNYFSLMGEGRADPGSEVRRIFAAWLVGLGILCLGGSLWAREMLQFLVPPEFQAAAAIVPAILCSYLLHGVYFFSVNPIFYFQKTRLLPLTTGSAALLNIGLNYLLIPRLGILGAAYATLAAHAFLTLSVYFAGRRYHDPHYPLRKVGICLAWIILPVFTALPGAVTWPFQLLKVAVVMGYGAVSITLFAPELRSLIASRKQEGAVDGR